MNSRNHIVVVEDEKHLGIGIKYNLEAEGYRVTLIDEGPTALRMVKSDPEMFDLMILDLMLPGMSGYAVCETLREMGVKMPILILSARNLAEDRARGFDVGANQYLSKPFDLDELLSRVKNLLRLSGSAQAAPIKRAVKKVSEVSFGRAVINFESHEVHVAGRPIRLTQKELRLLRYFVENEGRVISRQELLCEVWDMPGDMQTRSVDQFVMRLRKMFEKNPTDPQYFLTFRDAGYRFISNPELASPEEEAALPEAEGTANTDTLPPAEND
jgi:DNA-binding response OmpR family regulator